MSKMDGKYYFYVAEEEKVYILKLKNTNPKTFGCFYLEIMANREEEFFENPIDTMDAYSSYNKRYFESLTVEPCTEERLEELEKEVGPYEVFVFNYDGVYDYYGYNNCQLYRDAIVSVLSDYEDFISNGDIIDFVHKSY